MIEPFPNQETLKECELAWDLSDLTFVRKMENVVFSAEKKGQKVYLRITSAFRRKKEEIEAEIDWIEHLEKSHIPVPFLLPHRGGGKILSLHQEGFSFVAVLFSHVEGAHPSEEILRNPSFLRKLGALIAKMHVISKTSTHSFFRENWDNERGLRHALEAMKNSKEKELIHLMENSLSWMKELPKTKKTYGLIHADLGAMNLFIKEDQSITIIDFDDGCYHWFVFDLAIVLYGMTARLEHFTPQEEEKEWFHHLIKGYASISPLTQEEIDWIPRFGHFATLRLFFWIEHHLTLKTFHETALDHVLSRYKWARERALSTQLP